ncbi:MAG: PEP-CTERM sorting domain-containing protein [Phycisphaerales bacterium]|nr:PEP-CTERM sorting domain-containing protein [Phycisphaerales bacterium]
MKANVVVALIGATALATTASAVDLANWTFESSVPTTAGPHAAELGLFGGASFASGFHVSSATVFSNPAGNGSVESFSSNNWGPGDYYQFTTSTVGFGTIEVLWDQNRSSTGPDTFDLEWSADGSTFFTLTNDYNVGAVTWSSGTPQPSSNFAAVGLPAAADGLATVWVRMTCQVIPAGTAGSNRIDNVVIRGTAIPTPGALALVGIGGLAAVRRRR